MGSLNVCIPLCVGVALSGLGLLFHMSGMATPHWSVRKEHGQRDIFSGLFESCQKMEMDGMVCSDLASIKNSGKYEALQAMAYLALVSGLIGVGAGIVFQFILTLSPHRVTSAVIISATAVATTACMFAFGFIMSILCLYGDRILTEHSTLQYSFFLCLLAMFLFLPAAICFFFAGRNLRNSSCGAGSSQQQSERNAETVEKGGEESIEVKGDAVEEEDKKETKDGEKESQADPASKQLLS